MLNKKISFILISIFLSSLSINNIRSADLDMKIADATLEISYINKTELEKKNTVGNLLLKQDNKEIKDVIELKSNKAGMFTISYEANIKLKNDVRPINHKIVQYGFTKSLPENIQTLLANKKTAITIKIYYVINDPIYIFFINDKGEKVNSPALVTSSIDDQWKEKSQ